MNRVLIALFLLSIFRLDSYSMFPGDSSGN